MKVLLIEDEPGIAKAIRRGLEMASFRVETAADGRTGLQMAVTGEYAVVILDLMLPGMDGMRVCEELRERRIRVPILMLTARGAVTDRVRGLEAGADDYLAKPFEFSELIARVQALIRRDRVHKSRVIRICDLEIDTGKRRVARGGAEIALTPREYQLLEALAAHEGEI